MKVAPAWRPTIVRLMLLNITLYCLCGIEVLLAHSYCPPMQRAAWLGMVQFGFNTAFFAAMLAWP